MGALGGALVLGAWPRMRRRMSVRASLLMGAGVALLAVSRPFEGSIVCLPIVCAMLLWAARLKPFLLRQAAVRVAAPAALVLATAAGLLGYYNSRVTGNPLRLPYAVNQQTYGWPLTLPWFHVQPHSHTFKAMHDYYLWETEEHGKVTDTREHLFLTMSDGLMLWSFYAGPVLSVFLLFLPWAARDRRVRLPAAMLAAGLVAVALEQSRYPHYFAPAAAAYLVLLMQSARHMRAIGARRKPARLTLFRLAPAVLVLVVAARAAVPPLRTLDSSLGHYMSWCCARPGNLDRAQVMERLSATAAQHLVIVRYGPKHKFMYEWVYNEPDIDRAKVVWARDMGDAGNQELIRYFAGRQVWLLDVDDDMKPAVLTPYSQGAVSQVP